jgi:flavin-dependent dehydrogenase
VTLSLASGLEAQARACVLACGANYSLQRRLGLGMPGVFLQSAQVERRLGLGRTAIPPTRGEPRQKMLPLSPVARTYGDRLLAVGDAAGLVKATTGGGIYYSLVSARLAADLLDDRLASDSLGERELQQYQHAWRRRLGAELDAQLSLRLLANRLSDTEIDALFELARTDGIMPIVRRTARFNQHRDLILSLLKHPPVRRIFYRRLAGSPPAAAF